MRSTQLRSFHAVASAGGFVAAAERLSVSQPTLTMQIAALEREFSVELFHRRNRRSELTTAGRDLFAITTRLFAEENEAREFLTSSKGLRTGHLRVGAVGPFHVTEMLAAFGKRYPGIRISVSVGNSLDVQRALLNYETDVAVLAHIDSDDRLITIPYSRHPIIIFVGRSHRFDGRPEILLRELEDERLIAREKGSTTRRAIDAALREQNVPVDASIEIGSREAIREAVIRGLGIGYVSEAEFVPDPALHAVRIADAEIFTVAQVVVLRERRNSRMIHAFTDVIMDTIRDDSAGRAAWK